jgi:hypothetical protein
MLQQLSGKDVKSSDYLEYIYNSLHNPQKIWKLNDATGKFEECRNFTKLMEGTLNEYVWRMGEHNGKLYIATMDAGIGYGYLTQLTNGSFLKMSREEMITKIGYVNEAIKVLAAEKLNAKTEELMAKLAMVKMMLEAFLPAQTGEGEEISPEQIKAIITTVSTLIDLYLSTLPGEDIGSKIALVVMTKVKESLHEISEKIDLVGLEKYLYVNNRVMNNKWGFDLYRTLDGETFETITQNGFDDKYNYGCPSFLSTEEGLYFGTCNPFYGGQLYLLSEKGTSSKIVTGIAEMDEGRSKTSDVWNDLSGRRLSGKPTTKGIYISGGHKVVIK